MKFNYYSIFIYFLLLVSFPFLHNQFARKPELTKIKFNNELKDTNLLTIKDLGNKANKVLMKKITLGNTYFITNSSKKTFQLTPISTWSLKNLNLKDLSDDLSDLIVQNTEIVKIRDNNYASGIINDKYFSQACMINSNKYFFNNFQSEVLQFSEIKHWYNIAIKSLKNNIFFYNIEPEVCLLITTSTNNNFEDIIHSVKNLIDF